MALNISGVLWLSGVTYITDPNSYNVGILRIKDWADAHGSATTVNSTVPDLHNTSHIQVNHTSISIAAVSSNADTTEDAFVAQITTRIHNIEGDGAASWGVGVAPMSLKTIANYINGITPLNAATATVAASATTAGSFSAPQPTKTTISDYKVVASGVANTVLVSPGGAYPDSAGVYVAADTSVRTVTLPAQPSGSNIQYCWITKPTSSGPSGFSSTPHASTNGVVGATPNPPAFPVGERPLALVIWRGTASGGIVLAADIIDIRLGDSGGTSAGGGTYTPAAPIVALGSSGSTFDLNSFITGAQLANATPINGITPASMRIRDTLIAKVSTDATMNDVMKSYIGLGYANPGILSASGGSVIWTPTAQSGDLVVQSGEDRRKIGSSTPLATRTSQNALTPGVTAAGRYLILADVAATPAGASYWYTQLVVEGTSPGAGQMIVAALWWDGNQFYVANTQGGVHYTALPTINGASYQQTKTGLYLGTPTTVPVPTQPSPSLIPGLTPTHLALPEPGMSIEFTWGAEIVQGSVADQAYLYAYYATGVAAPTLASQYTQVPQSGRISGNGIAATTSLTLTRKVRFTASQQGDYWFNILYAAPGSHAIGNLLDIFADIVATR